LYFTLKPLITIEETEEVLNMIRFKSLIYREEEAKKLLCNIFNKQYFVIDVDKDMPAMVIKNLRTRISVKPDFILIHLGNPSIIPNIIPVEIDWTLKELQRHMPKICEGIPVCIDVFPQNIIGNNVIRMSFVLNMTKTLRCYGNVLLAPVSMLPIDSSISRVLIVLPVYTIRPTNERMHIKFIEDMLISLIYVIYYKKVKEPVIRQLIPMIFSIAFRLGIFQRYRAKDKNLLKNTLLRSRLEIIITDEKRSKKSIEAIIMKETYLDFVNIMLKVFSSIIQ